MEPATMQKGFSRDTPQAEKNRDHQASSRTGAAEEIWGRERTETAEPAGVEEVCSCFISGQHEYRSIDKAV